MNEFIALLQQIADNTRIDNSVWVAAVAGGAAVLGASVSAVVSYFITKRTVQSQSKIETKRLRVNVVTTERLRWLQDIRERISDLYVQLDMQFAIIQQPTDDAKKEQVQEILNQYSVRVMKQVNMVTLMLNEKVPEQKTLIDELQKTLVFMRKCFYETTQEGTEFDKDEYTSIKTKVFSLAMSIAGKTWSEIENLE